MKKDNTFKIVKFVIVLGGILLIFLFPFLYDDRTVYQLLVWLYAIAVNVLGILKTIMNKENVPQRLLMSIITLVSIGIMFSNIR
ncbi:MAG: hypothetical protein VB096_08155 [Pseudoflavonifractor sp.]|nr:hypothetical protein [Pseudoflavonifractor sp.]